MRRRWQFPTRSESAGRWRTSRINAMHSKSPFHHARPRGAETGWHWSDQYSLANKLPAPPSTESNARNKALMASNCRWIGSPASEKSGCQFHVAPVARIQTAAPSAATAPLIVAASQARGERCAASKPASKPASAIKSSVPGVMFIDSPCRGPRWFRRRRGRRKSPRLPPRPPLVSASRPGAARCSTGTAVPNGRAARVPRKTAAA